MLSKSRFERDCSYSSEISCSSADGYHKTDSLLSSVDLLSQWLIVKTCGSNGIRSKAKANRENHRVSFDEVTRLFTSGIDFLEIFDESLSDDEERFVAIGPVAGEIVVVVYTERQEDVVRIVSARRASTREVALFHRYYEETNQ